MGAWTFADEFVTADTAAGRFRGLLDDGVGTFLGIRYGSAPTGRGRFLPALPAQRVSETVDALAAAPSAVQNGFRAEYSRGHGQFRDRLGASWGTARSMGEDCLALNVWAPTGGERLPVMVWIHGGIFRSGSGIDLLSTGEHLARTGRAVVVSLNHRLGLLGHLRLDHLLGDRYAKSGVVGLTDIVLALEWVRDHAGSFGGDPNNVTLFGHSGGGIKIAALLTSSAVAGLVHKSILQSSGGEILDADQGIDQTDRALAAFGLDRSNAESLLTLPTKAFVAAQAILDPQHHGPCPVRDGDFLPEESVLATQGTSAPANAVPMIIGTTPHESSFALCEQPWYRELDFDALPAVVDQSLPGRGLELAADYRGRFPGENAQLIYSRIVTDRTFGPVTAAVADWKAGQDAAVFRYEFAYTSDAPDDVLGAPHCMDLPFVLGTLGVSDLAGSRPERFRLADEMANAWLSFAETGVPRTPPGFDWPRYSPGQPGTTAHIDAHGWSATTLPTLGWYNSERLV